VIELLLDADDVSHTRLAFSPLWEAVYSVRALQAPARRAVHLPWVRQTRELIRQLPDRDLLQALVPPRGYLPDFLSPPPASPLPSLAAELAELRSTPSARVRNDLERAYPRGLPPVLADLHARPRSHLRRISDVIDAYADLALLPHWPRIRDLLEGDIRYRSLALARGGPHELFADLHPRISWTGEALRIEAHHQQRRVLAGEGVLLVPSAFGWPDVLVISATGLQPTVFYPVRGIALLWETQAEPGPEPLRALIGPTRAQVLQQTASPASTVELARRLGVTAGNISQHLGVLRRAGLVTGHRSGPVVLYARTELGDELIGGRRQ